MLSSTNLQWIFPTLLLLLFFNGIFSSNAQTMAPSIEEEPTMEELYDIPMEPKSIETTTLMEESEKILGIPIAGFCAIVTIGIIDLLLLIGIIIWRTIVYRKAKKSRAINAAAAAAVKDGPTVIKIEKKSNATSKRKRNLETPPPISSSILHPNSADSSAPKKFSTPATHVATQPAPNVPGAPAADEDTLKLLLQRQKPGRKESVKTVNNDDEPTLKSNAKTQSKASIKRMISTSVTESNIKNSKK